MRFEEVGTADELARVVCRLRGMGETLEPIGEDDARETGAPPGGYHQHAVHDAAEDQRGGAANIRWINRRMKAMEAQMQQNHNYVINGIERNARRIETLDPVGPDGIDDTQDSIRCGGSRLRRTAQSRRRCKEASGSQ